MQIFYGPNALCVTQPMVPKCCRKQESTDPYHWHGFVFSPSITGLLRRPSCLMPAVWHQNSMLSYREWKLRWPLAWTVGELEVCRGKCLVRETGVHQSRLAVAFSVNGQYFNTVQIVKPVCQIFWTSWCCFLICCLILRQMTEENRAMSGKSLLLKPLLSWGMLVTLPMPWVILYSADSGWLQGVALTGIRWWVFSLQQQRIQRPSTGWTCCASCGSSSKAASSYLLENVCCVFCKMYKCD